jgi:hypothetical protein
MLEADVAVGRVDLVIAADEVDVVGHGHLQRYQQRHQLDGVRSTSTESPKKMERVSGGLPLSWNQR